MCQPMTVLVRDSCVAASGSSTRYTAFLHRQGELVIKRIQDGLWQPEFVHAEDVASVSPASGPDNVTGEAKVAKWDGTAVKNALDDAVKEVLVSYYNYVENFKLIDGRLAICTVAVLVALFALAWDYLHPFPASKPILIVCVGSYFVLMGVLTLYTNYTEKGTFVVAQEKCKSGLSPDVVWKSASSLKKYDDKYTLTLSCDGAEMSVERSVGDFYDVNGVLVRSEIDNLVKKMHNDLSKKKNQ